MGGFGDHRVLVLVHAVQAQRREFVLQAQRRTGQLVPADRLLLEVDVGAVPVLQRHADAAHDEIAAAAHPVRTFGIHPDDLVDVFSGVWVPSLKPSRLRGVPPSGGTRQETGLRPADLRRAARQTGKLAYRMERHLRIVGAGLDRQIAAGSLRHQAGRR